jgi:hypothetical protein
MLDPDQKNKDQKHWNALSVAPSFVFANVFCESVVKSTSPGGGGGEGRISSFYHMIEHTIQAKGKKGTIIRNLGWATLKGTVVAPHLVF